MINSERETIWARHNALLVANSLIVGALAVSPAALGTTRWAGLAVIGAGLLISTAWLLITIHGWLAMRQHTAIASAFTAEHFKHLPNPFADLTYRRSSLWIHGLALAMICTFIAIYLVSVWRGRSLESSSRRNAFLTRSGIKRPRVALTARKARPYKRRYWHSPGKSARRWSSSE